MSVISLFIAPIVEGHGEVQAVPALLHRWHAAQGLPQLLLVNHPIRVKRDRFINDQQEFRRHVILAAAKVAAHERGLVLILLDSDDACPKELGPKLLARAKGVRADVNYLVVLAKKEFEVWFIASAEALRGTSGLSEAVVAPRSPEGIRGAKEWLSKHMSASYDEITDQLAFVRKLDFAEAARARSFARFSERLNTWCRSA